MKRIIAVSDSHGSAALLKKALEQAVSRGRVDAAVFLGDGASDLQQVQGWLYEQGIACYSVKGNNDWRSSDPEDITFTVNGVRFYACHGHTRYVKYGLDRLWYAAQEREAKVVLYGHTHRERVDEEYGIQLINPGAVCECAANRSAYAELLVHDNGFVQAQLCKWVRE